MKWIVTHFQVVSAQPIMPYGSPHNTISNSRSMHVNKNPGLLKGLAFLSPTLILVLFSPLFKLIIQQREKHRKEQAQMPIYAFFL